MKTVIIPVNQDKLHMPVDVRGFGSNTDCLSLSGLDQCEGKSIATNCQYVYLKIDYIPIYRYIY